jgi:hypothetical protein
VRFMVLSDEFVSKISTHPTGGLPGGVVLLGKHVAVPGKL